MKEKYQQANCLHMDGILSTMSESFKESKKVISFFFEEKRLLVHNCYICTLNNKIVSLINIINLKLKINNTILNGAYVYGACTLEEYRNQGYMSNLLKYVQTVCSNKNYDCLFLSPANPKLELFYERLGYNNFFKVKEVVLDYMQMSRLIASEIPCEKNVVEDYFNPNNIEQFRKNIYDNSNYVVYDNNDIDFAIKMYTTFSKGKLIYSDFGYGICVRTPANDLKVIDFTCKTSHETIKLLEKIRNEFPHINNYVIQTSITNTFFESFGNTCYNGMILPLTKRCKDLIKNLHFSKDAYLGISLE